MRSDSKRNAVFFRSDGEENEAATDYATGYRYKLVITDENGEAKKDSNGNIMYCLGPHPSKICGKNFRLPHPKTGLPTHVTTGKSIDDYDKGLKKNAVRQAHFEVKFSKDDNEDIMSYNDIVDFMSRDTMLYDGEFWHFCKILGHKEVDRRSPTYKGSKFNLQILWENGEITDEPLTIFGRDAPVECAIYAKENKLLNTSGWKKF